MSGLRPGEEKPLTDDSRAGILAYWNQVAEATGMPFDRKALDVPGFVYNTGDQGGLRPYFS